MGHSVVQHSHYYNEFIADCSFLLVQQTPGVFLVAPQIDTQTILRVYSFFSLRQDEDILLIRWINADSYVVLTDQGVYHNAGSEPFSLRWDYISKVGGSINEFTFYRNQRILYQCNAAFFVYGLPIASPNRTRFFLFMKKLPRYSGLQGSQETVITKAFEKAFSRLDRYLYQVVYLPERTKDLGSHGFPEDERVLLFREPELYSKTELYLTDRGIHYFAPGDEFSARWDSIHSVHGHKDNIVFSEKKGNTRAIPLNHIVNCEKGFFESKEKYYSHAHTVAKALSEIIDSTECKYDHFEYGYTHVSQKAQPIIGKDIYLDPKLFKMRCPVCGSNEYAIAQAYYDRIKKDKLKHDLQDLVTGAVQTYFDIGEPSRSPYFSNEQPEYLCSKCGASWRSLSTSIL